MVDYCSRWQKNAKGDKKWKKKEEKASVITTDKKANKNRGKRLITRKW